MKHSAHSQCPWVLWPPQLHGVWTNATIGHIAHGTHIMTTRATSSSQSSNQHVRYADNGKRYGLLSVAFSLAWFLLSYSYSYLHFFYFFFLSLRVYLWFIQYYNLLLYVFRIHNNFFSVCGSQARASHRFLSNAFSFVLLSMWRHKLCLWISWINVHLCQRRMVHVPTPYNII